jgi:hypothetical protein
MYTNDQGLHKRQIEWRWGALAALAITLVGLYPQVHLWWVRGREWQGSYVLMQGDETAYSAYVNALIDGRPRRNDPFNGRDVPTYETLHSIQFIPAYAVALPARLLGLSGSTAFVWLLVLAALASSLAIFWLLAMLTGDSKSAAVGTLLILCFGATVGSDCCWQANAFTDMLPFLRRYQPAAAFPLFFVFCVFVWRALTRHGSRTRAIYSIAAGTVLAVLVFSYFYLWTAALGWFACVVLLWLLLRRDEFRRVAVTTIVIATFAMASIAGFLHMFRERDPLTQEGQLLVTTHAFDLFNQPEIIAFIALGVLIHAVWRKLVDIRSPLVLVTIAFTLLPFVVFNQQVLTGLSLQPLHYKAFIANYVAIVSVVLVFLILRRSVSRSVLLVATVVALGWGLIEVSNATERRTQMATQRDDVVAVAKRLTAMANEDGSLQAARMGQAPYPTVFTMAVDETLEASIGIPSDSPLAVLWSLHSHAFIGLAASKERFYRQLYYSGMTPKQLSVALRENEFWVVLPLFGAERRVRGLVTDFKPVTREEIQAEHDSYTEFYNNFAREQATSPMLNFVIAPDGLNLPNFANLDRWYERDTGQRVGSFTIYRVKLRTS